jgi:hypothetical protein
MIHYTAWRNGRLERRRIAVIGQSDLAAWVAMGLAMVALFLIAGCASADGSASTDGSSPEAQRESFEGPEEDRVIPLCPGEDPPMADECQRLVYGSPGVPGYCNRWVTCPSSAEPVAAKPAPPIMYVAPVPEMLELTLLAADLIRLESGALIEVSDSGIPVRIHDGDRQGSAGCKDGVCYFYLSSETAARDDGFALNSLAHEFVHVLSKFGACSSEADKGGHLPLGNIVSNGNTGYAQMSWTDADTRLACSCGACP